MKTFQTLNPKRIRNHVIFLDVDGTLTHDGAVEVDARSLKIIEELKKGNTIYLCSNRKKHARNEAIALKADIPYLKTSMRKPNKKIIELIHQKDKKNQKEFLVIGDKWMTDGLFAKNIGAKLLMVKRLRSPKDWWPVKLSYWLDDLLNRLGFFEKLKELRLKE